MTTKRVDVYVLTKDKWDTKATDLEGSVTELGLHTSYTGVVLIYGTECDLADVAWSKLLSEVDLLKTQMHSLFQVMTSGRVFVNSTLRESLSTRLNIVEEELNRKSNSPLYVKATAFLRTAEWFKREATKLQASIGI